MSHRSQYQQWPFLTQEEFELACAFFDAKYVRAELEPTRKIFKVRHRRSLATGMSFIEILRLLNLPEDDDDLALAFGKMGGHEHLSSTPIMEIDGINEDGDEVSV